MTRREAIKTAVQGYLDTVSSLGGETGNVSAEAIAALTERVLAETQATPSQSEEHDDPFCWYIVQRDITDEYTTVYSEAENCPGPNWKPLYERPQAAPSSIASTEAAYRCAAKLLREEVKRLDYPKSMYPQEAAKIAKRQEAFEAAACYLEGDTVK